MLRSLHKNPRLTASKIALDIREKHKKSICDDIVRKFFKKAGYHGRVARRKPLISLVNRQKLLAFAREHLNKPADFWNKVIFSDEGKFCIFDIKGCKLVWRKPCTELN